MDHVIGARISPELFKLLSKIPKSSTEKVREALWSYVSSNSVDKLSKHDVNIKTNAAEPSTKANIYYRLKNIQNSITKLLDEME